MLLGAGFSANWGAPVAKKFAHKLLSDPTLFKFHDIRTFLFEKQNFEQALGKFYKHEGYNALYSAVEREFNQIALQQKELRDQPSEYTKIFGEISLFVARLIVQKKLQKQEHLLFSLNQDMLLEYNFSRRENFPGIDRIGPPMLTQSGKETCRLGEIDVPEKLLPSNASNSVYTYTKLHGSIDWLIDGDVNQFSSRRSLIVIGNGKELAIQNNKLLKDGYDTFFEALDEADVLYLHGVSLTDEHISRRIAKMIKEDRLKIFIHDPKAWDVLENFMNGNGLSTNQLVRNLAGIETKTMYELSLGDMEQIIFSCRGMTGEELLPRDPYGKNCTVEQSMFDS